jgi:hypothetical protein
MLAALGAMLPGAALMLAAQGALQRHCWMEQSVILLGVTLLAAVCQQPQ